jgi:hypothetical protein
MSYSEPGAKNVAGHKVKIPGYRIDKSGKLQKSTKGLSVSKQIAVRKKPKQTWRGAK